MSNDAIAAFALAFTMLVALLGFVWKAASVSTSHELRIKTLERNSEGTAAELRAQIKELEGVINDLRRGVWDLTTKLKVNAARASQGQFDDSDRPPRE